ncbi:hypothetical protein [Bacteroides acidifaciens]|uniref:hypothetical protein n=1 Tax=Bacteroides acidifaciens TaxID=85831 RepID=UPI00263B3CDC|nr:hypothetical protein [Bacteroides acidifaciens]
MKLHELLNQVEFDNVFSDILSHVPEVENQRARFKSAFDILCSVRPAKKSETVIEVLERDYLGEGTHDLWINANCARDSDLWESLLAGQIELCSTLVRLDEKCKITDEMIVADLLWQLVALGFPEKSAILSGYLLNNRRFPESTKAERIEEICSYIDNHHVTGISHEGICKYLTAKNVSWIADITSYSLPKDKAAYDITCFLDDFMWFNNETKTILIISASEGYEEEVAKIEEFANSMLKNPLVVYGRPKLPGIEVLAIFITE